MSTADTPKMTAMRPYLARALMAWINDNGMTPYVLVDATIDGNRVPAGSIKDGKIILNLSERATSGLTMSDEAIAFSARFSGRVFEVFLPMASIQAIFANETGLGMAMPMESQGNTAVSSGKQVEADKAEKEKKARRAHLRVVK